MRRDRSAGLLFILVLIGALLGSIVGEALSKSVPLLARGVSVGVDPPTTLDLFILKVTFGIKMKLNVASAVGILLGLLFFRRV